MKRTTLALCLALAPWASQAGDIEEAIAAGQAAYQQGKLSQAASQLAYAATLIQQQQGEQLSKLFPPPLAGWTADEPEHDNASMSLLGGGVHSERLYYKGDDISLTLRILKDSPLMQALAGMLASPQMAAMAGYKLKKINGANAMLQTQDDMNLTLVQGSVMVQIECDGCEEADLVAYAGKMDLTAMEQL